MSAMETMLAGILKSAIGEDAARMLTPENLNKMGQDAAKMIDYFKTQSDQTLAGVSDITKSLTDISQAMSQISATQSLILSKLSNSGIPGLDWSVSERMLLGDNIIQEQPDDNGSFDFNGSDPYAWREPGDQYWANAPVA